MFPVVRCGGLERFDDIFERREVLDPAEFGRQVSNINPAFIRREFEVVGSANISPKFRRGDRPKLSRLKAGARGVSDEIPKVKVLGFIRRAL